MSHMPCYQYMPYFQMMSQNLCYSPIMKYPVGELDKMYPRIYHMVYPKIKHMCVIVDTPDNPDMYPCPRRAAVEKMVDDVYRATIMEMGDPGDYNWSEEMGDRQPVPFGLSGLTPRMLFRDLILILLLRELLSRRGMFF